MNAVRALLVTDLVDSTAIADRIGDAAMSALWVEHDRLARDLLLPWRGREIDRSDGFFLLFDHAADALGYALAWHDALAQLGRERLATFKLELRSRAGVHVGAVNLRANPAPDVARGAKPLEADGLAKAVASRVMSLARGGQTLLTAAAHETLLGEQPRALPPLRCHGHWKLKGVADPIELFEAGGSLTAFAPPADSEKVHRVVWREGRWLPAREVGHSLPAEPDSFIGRSGALRSLAELFDTGARLVCVHGMGGSGKTRLALHYGWRWLGDFAAGVWFCDLAAARDLDGVVRAVAQGLQVPLGRSDAVEQLGHAIAGRGECLLIVDNFEQVSALAESTLWRWLRRAPKARFLVTSRELLHLPGERVLELEPLSRTEGAELFRQRAAAAHAPAASSDEQGAVESLVELLDGLPLAIELAAARSALLAPQELLRRMGERFGLLVGGRGRSERQATLRATLDWSWELLSDAERSVLAQLSVFEGGATVAAAEATIDLHGIEDAPAVLDLLQSLVDKSFVRSGAKHRLVLLEMVREYAAECLATAGRFTGSGPGAVAAARRRHAMAFAAMAEREALHDGCIELPNLIAATRHAAADGDAGVAAKVLLTTWAALRLRGPFALGRDLTQLVLAMAGLTSLDRARAHRTLGGVQVLVGVNTEAGHEFEVALQHAIAAGDLRLQAEVRAHLGDQRVVAGRQAEGRAELAQALAGAREAADLALEAQVLASLGAADQHAGMLDAAAGHYEQSLAVARRIGDRRREGGVLGNLATVRYQQGRWAEARVLCESALGASRDSGNLQWSANTQSNLGLMLLQQGELEPAREALESALRAARELGHRRLECIALSNLGQVAEALNDDEAARERFEQAVALAQELGDRLSAGQVGGYLAALHGRHDRFDEARALFEASADALRGVGGPASLGLLLCDRAWLEHRAGDSAAALRARDAALRIADEITAAPGSELRQRLARLDVQLAGAAR